MMVVKKESKLIAARERNVDGKLEASPRRSRPHKSIMVYVLRARTFDHECALAGRSWNTKLTYLLFVVSAMMIDPPMK